MISLGTEQYHVGGEDNSDKIKLFLFLSLMCPNWWVFFPPSSGLLELLHWKALLPQKLFFFCGWLSKTVFSEVSWTVVERGWSRFTGHCRIHCRISSTEIFILLRSTQMGKAFYGSCGICVEPHTSIKVLWVDTKLLLRKGYKWEMFYLALLLTSLQGVLWFWILKKEYGKIIKGQLKL